jgi:hypothetical protein
MELSVHLPELILMLVVSTVIFSCGMPRIALLVNFSFTFYWAYIENFDKFFNPRFETLTQASGLYFMVGLGVFILFLLALFIHQY